MGEFMLSQVGIFDDRNLCLGHDVDSQKIKLLHQQTHINIIAG